MRERSGCRPCLFLAILLPTFPQCVCPNAPSKFSSNRTPAGSRVPLGTSRFCRGTLSQHRCRRNGSHQDHVQRLAVVARPRARRRGRRWTDTTDQLERHVQRGLESGDSRTGARFPLGAGCSRVPGHLQSGSRNTDGLLPRPQDRQDRLENHRAPWAPGNSWQQKEQPGQLHSRV